MQRSTEHHEKTSLPGIENREKRATKGPWKVERHDDDDGSISHEIWNLTAEHYTRIMTLSDSNDDPNAKANAAFIAHAREDIPWLLSQWRAQKARIEELEGRADTCGEIPTSQEVIDKALRHGIRVLYEQFSDFAKERFKVACLVVEVKGRAKRVESVDELPEDKLRTVYDLCVRTVRKYADSPTITKGEGK